jgi:hypothetical protein
MNSKIVLVVIILFSIAIYSCKEEEVKVDLAIGLVGAYSGEFQWLDYMNNWELKKGEGILTIKKIDEAHVEISDNLGLFNFDFMVVSEIDANGAINFYQDIVSPLYGNLPFGYMASGNRHENKIEFYFSYNQLKFSGDLVQ